MMPDTNNEAATIAVPTRRDPWLQTPTEMESATVATDTLVFAMNRASSYVGLSVTADRLRVMVTFIESLEPFEEERYRYSRSDFTAHEFLTAIARKQGCYEVYGWPSATHPDPDDNEFSAEHTLAFCPDHDGRTMGFSWYAGPGEPVFHLRLPMSHLRSAPGQGD